MRGGLLGILLVLLLIVGGVYALLVTLTSYTIANMTFFVLVAAITILVILIQKPKGGGLAGAFGGGGGGQQAMFGAKSGDALTWFTIILFACFLTLAIALVFSTRGDFHGVPVDQGKDAIAGQADTDTAAPQKVEDVETIGGGDAPTETPETPAPKTE